MDKLNCGQGIGLECKCHREWLVQNLGSEDVGYDFYEPLDMIQERIGMKLKCERELLRS
jgi:hypothetical protein